MQSKIESSNEDAKKPNTDVPTIKIRWSKYSDQYKKLSLRKNQTILVSKNGGKSFSSWIPRYDRNPIFVDRFIPTKNFLYAESSTNKKFFYADSDLILTSIQTYESRASISPSTYDPSYLYKLLRTNSPVSYNSYIT
ncbi:hypothetical protein RF11_15600 [Thelohanellus kitauei]|uniref:Uncharacterized protein n=1 Tax=Thelohanellus kitauei TaxID=669202 RepID=A0A0C2J7V9_THEKT|nr:hypothetical protein RF11_15600 [Thelohanellus kitauei]